MALQNYGGSEERASHSRPSPAGSRLKNNGNSPRGLSDDLCDNAAMSLICPTCQIFLTLKQISKMQRNSFDKLKLLLASIVANEKPAAGLPARALRFSR
jgi:hypothetical protein